MEWSTIILLSTLITGLLFVVAILAGQAQKEKWTTWTVEMERPGTGSFLTLEIKAEDGSSAIDQAERQLPGWKPIVATFVPPSLFDPRYK